MNHNKPHFLAVLILIMLLGLASIAQNTALNYSKYTHYRERLLNEFMVSSAGNEPGTNIPASITNIYTHQMRWGDATINLNNYILMLATEYKLLKMNNQPYDHSLMELHRALLALERLDMSAEAFYGAPQKNTPVNGFFIRDDIPASFTKDWAWHNPSFSNFPNTGSDFIAPNPRDNEMSQDQVWHLLNGLAMVSHLVDDTTTYYLPGYYDKDRLTLAERARTMAYHFVRIMQHEKCLIRCASGNQFFCRKYWSLVNPITGMKVKRGADPGFLKFGFAEAGNFITNESFYDLHWGTSERTKLFINLVKYAQKLQSLSKTGDHFPLFHASVLATISDMWSPNQLIRTFNRHRKGLITPYPQHEHFALQSVILHNESSKLVEREKYFYEYLLNTAPMHGPRNYGDDPELPLVYEWSSTNRLVWPERNGSKVPPRLYGDYNGLDYLVLFNLYALVYQPYFLSDL